jgi:hypothetical protein
MRSFSAWSNLVSLGRPLTWLALGTWSAAPAAFAAVEPDGDLLGLPMFSVGRALRALWP